MGLRLQIVDSTGRTQPDTGKIPPTIVSPPSAQQNSGQPQRPVENREAPADSFAVEGDAGQRLELQRASKAAETQTSGDEANKSGYDAAMDSASSAPRIRQFRYLAAARSLREQQLTARRQQLERQIETIENRLRLADSLSEQIDIQLQQAKLEQDVRTVSSQERRLILERVVSSRLSDSPSSKVSSRQELPAEGHAKTVASAQEAKGINIIA